MNKKNLDFETLYMLYDFVRFARNLRATRIHRGQRVGGLLYEIFREQQQLRRRDENTNPRNNGQSILRLTRAKAVFDFVSTCSNTRLRDLRVRERDRARQLALQIRSMLKAPL